MKNAYNLLPVDHKSLRIFIGEISAVFKNGLCRVTSHGRTLKDVQIPSWGGIGFGFQVPPKEGQKAIVISNDSRYRDLYLIAVYNPKGPDMFYKDQDEGNSKVDYVPGGMFFGTPDGSKFSIRPSGFIEMEASPLASIMLKPSEAAVVNFASRFQVYSSPQSVLRLISNPPDEGEEYGDGFFELMVGDKTPSDGNLMPPFLWTIGSTHAPNVHEGNPRPKAFSRMLYRKTDDLDPSMLIMSNQFDFLTSDGYLEKGIAEIDSKKVKIYRRLGFATSSPNHQKPLISQNWIQIDGDTSHYEEYAADGGRDYYNKELFQNFGADGKFSLGNRDGRSWFFLSGDSIGIMNKLSSGFQASGDSSFISGKSRIDVMTEGGAGMTALGGNIVQLKNSACAMSLSSSTALFSAPVGAPAFLFGVTGPPPLPSVSTINTPKDYDRSGMSDDSEEEDDDIALSSSPMYLGSYTSEKSNKADVSINGEVETPDAIEDSQPADTSTPLVQFESGQVSGGGNGIGYLEFNGSGASIKAAFPELPFGDSVIPAHSPSVYGEVGVDGSMAYVKSVGATAILSVDGALVTINEGQSPAVKGDVNLEILQSILAALTALSSAVASIPVVGAAASATANAQIQIVNSKLPLLLSQTVKLK